MEVKLPPLQSSSLLVAESGFSRLFLGMQHFAPLALVLLPSTQTIRYSVDCMFDYESIHIDDR